MEICGGCLASLCVYETKYTHYNPVLSSCVCVGIRFVPPCVLLNFQVKYSMYVCFQVREAQKEVTGQAGRHGVNHSHVTMC